VAVDDPVEPHRRRARAGHGHHDARQPRHREAVPADAAIWDAARREVVEETGADLLPCDTPPLSGLDVHGIPAGKGEPYHLHHDILFHFRAATDRTQVSEESHAVIWCAPADFDRYQVPDNVRRAYRRMRKLVSTP
jgi:8-oxo-dGTP pyrophosphatase MutT (NUDIX family)